MLIISRRPNQTIVFPRLGITVQISRISGSTVRLGVTAPRDVVVLRGELMTPDDWVEQLEPSQHHAVRNLLNRLNLALHLARRQAQVGLHDASDATLGEALEALELLERDWVPPPRPERTMPRILIVDDDANERELLAGLLRMNGAVCETASDGEAALQALELHPDPDVMLLDMFMPHCDGPETIRRLRASDRHRGLRVLTVSATNPEELGIPIGPDGVNGWFAKPLNPIRLWEAIQASRN